MVAINRSDRRLGEGVELKEQRTKGGRRERRGETETVFPPAMLKELQQTFFLCP